MSSELRAWLQTAHSGTYTIERELSPTVVIHNIDAVLQATAAGAAKH